MGASLSKDGEGRSRKCYGLARVRPPPRGERRCSGQVGGAGVVSGWVVGGLRYGGEETMEEVAQQKKKYGK